MRATVLAGLMVHGAPAVAAPLDWESDGGDRVGGRQQDAALALSPRSL